MHLGSTNIESLICFLNSYPVVEELLVDMVLRTVISLEIALLTKRRVLLLSLAILALPQARFRAERSCLSGKSPT